MIFLWVWLLAMPIAHDADGNPDPPPVTCPQRCKKVQCDCVEACKKAGAEPGYSSCFTDCYDQMQACDARCQFTLRSLP